MVEPGFEPNSLDYKVELFPFVMHLLEEAGVVEGGWSRERAGAITYRSVFILQTGAGDGAAIQEDPALGRSPSPTTLKFVVQQCVLPKDEPPRLPAVDNVALGTDRKALRSVLHSGRGISELR
jgi:hypothetical protein